MRRVRTQPLASAKSRARGLLLGGGEPPGPDAGWPPRTGASSNIVLGGSDKAKCIGRLPDLTSTGATLRSAPEVVSGGRWAHQRGRVTP